ncbi:MAG: NHLP bacteriocin system secretion protein, partial [Cyanobium sp. ELA507]
MESSSPKLPPRRHWLEQTGGRLRNLGPRQQLGAVLALMGGAVGAWALFWLVPTEVVGKGVLLLPDNAGLLDARAAGQVLVELYLPVLEKELEQQRANLRELERQNRALDERDRLRLETESASVETSLSKLRGDAERYGALRNTYASKLRNLEWLARREV